MQKLIMNGLVGLKSLVGGVFFILLMGGWQTVVWGADPTLRGPAFSDPTKLVEMPQEWLDKKIEYDPAAKKEKADVVITLDQEIFLMFGKQVAKYGKEKGINIVNQEGTCGISDGFMMKKQADLAGYCCGPAAPQRVPTLKFHTLGIAAKVFIVHPDNPVDNLTFDQLQEIYHGDYTNWSEIKGLENAPNIPLHVVGRLHCKARPGHWRLLIDHENQFSPRMKEVSNIPDVITEVMNSPGSIGYDTLTNISHYVKGKGPKLLKVNGADPHDKAAIASLRYPLYRTFELSTWEGEGLRNKHVDELQNFMLKAVEKLGPEYSFVPVSMLREAGWQFYGDEVVGEPIGQKPSAMTTANKKEVGHDSH